MLGKSRMAAILITKLTRLQFQSLNWSFYVYGKVYIGEVSIRFSMITGHGNSWGQF